MFGLNYEYKSVNKCNNNIVTHKCGFCGKLVTYDDGKQYLHEEQVKKNQCHTLKINRTGYGSDFEDREIEIPICDECAMLLDESAVYYYNNQHLKNGLKTIIDVVAMCELDLCCGNLVQQRFVKCI